MRDHNWQKEQKKSGLACQKNDVLHKWLIVMTRWDKCERKEACNASRSHTWLSFTWLLSFPALQSATAVQAGRLYMAHQPFRTLPSVTCCPPSPISLRREGQNRSWAMGGDNDAISFFHVLLLVSILSFSTFFIFALFFIKRPLPQPASINKETYTLSTLRRKPHILM